MEDEQMTGVEFVLNVEGVPTLYEDLPHAVCAGQYLFVSTMVGVNPDTGRIVMSLDELSDEEPRQLISGRLAADSWSGPIQAQCWQMFKNIERVLQSQGAQLQDILRINMWVTDFSDLPMLAPVRSLVFAPEVPPPITNIGVCDIPVPGAVIQAEVVAALPSRGGKRVSIDSPNVSQFVGHYGLASRSGPVAFAAGMIAASNEQRRVIRSYADLGVDQDLRTGSFVPDSREEITAAQTRFIMNDVRAALSDQGCSLDDIAYLRAYLKEFDDFAPWARVMTQTFADAQMPPVTVIPCTELGVHDFRLEIEVVLDVSDQGPVHAGSNLPTTLPGCPTLSRAGDLVFVAGQYGVDSERGQLVMSLEHCRSRVAKELASGGLVVRLREGPVAAQTEIALRNLERVLKDGEMSMDQVAKLDVYLLDPVSIRTVTEVIRDSFGAGAAPVCNFVVVPWLPLSEAHLQVEATVMHGT
jgi:enamine deaminase RidA (YjgF/YER057c/UK114 family)